MSKKILLLIPNFGFGGAQRIFSDHAKMFSDTCQVEECVFNMSEENFYPTGNVVHDLNIEAGTNFFWKIWRFLQRVKKVRQLKRKNNYDVSISHLEGADYVNILSRQSEKIILVIHGSKLADENISGVIGFLRSKILLPVLYRRADLIASTSDAIKVELEKAYRIDSSKIISIPNYYDVENIEQQSLSESDEWVTRLKRNNQLLLYSGRFAKQKNLLPLFSIFKKITVKKDKVKLILVGDGELKKDLLNECDRLGLSYYIADKEFNEGYDVYFLGYKKNPFSIIRQCDLFIMTSKWEGFPMALCEAMAVGACIVSADCPTGPAQILNYAGNDNGSEKAGLLLPIPLLESESLLNQWEEELVTLLEHEEIRIQYALAAKKRIKEFSKENVGKKWVAILNKL